MLRNYRHAIRGRFCLYPHPRLSFLSAVAMTRHIRAPLSGPSVTTPPGRGRQSRGRSLALVTSGPPVRPRRVSCFRCRVGPLCRPPSSPAAVPRPTDRLAERLASVYPADDRRNPAQPGRPVDRPTSCLVSPSLDDISHTRTDAEGRSRAEVGTGGTRPWSHDCPVSTDDEGRSARAPRNGQRGTAQRLEMSL